LLKAKSFEEEKNKDIRHTGDTHHITHKNRTHFMQVFVTSSVRNEEPQNVNSF